MFHRFVKWLPVLAVLLLFCALTPGPLGAGHNSITQTDVQVLKWQDTVPIAPSGFARTRPFLRGQDPTKPSDLLARQGLGVATDISVMFSCSGTSPSYKVEVLCSMDGVTFVKPTVGGDLGTFTGTDPQFAPVAVPLSPGGIILKFTELGGNALTPTATAAGQ